MQHIEVFIILITLLGSGCASAVPLAPGAAPTAVEQLQLSDLAKVGPELRRVLLQRGRPALAQPERLNRELGPLSVIVRAREDISQQLAARGMKVHSVTQGTPVIITGEALPASLPAIIGLSDVVTIELSQAVPPAQEDADVP